MPEVKTCWQCGAGFGCGASDDGPCWCAALPPVPPDAGADCLCPACLRAKAVPDTLSAGVDYYMEGRAMVFTAAYHLRRGYCCGSGCRHCPYSKAR